MSSFSPAAILPSSAPAMTPTQLGLPCLDAHSGEDIACHRRQYSEAEWQAKRLIIKQLYMDLKKPLNQVMATMSQEHDFHATRKMYVTRLASWGFAKNYTKTRISNLLHQKRERDAVNKVSNFGREERMVDSRGIDKYLMGRKKDAEIFTAVERGAVRTDVEAITHSPPQGDQHPSAQTLDPGDYECNCPYRPWRKKFRLVEKLPSGSLYEGDSFGFHSYIATDEERPCTLRCFCRQHELSKAFTFVVYKSLSEMDINIFSDELYSTLLELLDLKDLRMGVVDGPRTINGFILLKHYHILRSHLSNLDSKIPHSPTDHSLFLDMKMLVDGLLADGEVFKSFGYEDLYERGFLEFKLWKKFQQDKLQRDISALEGGFWDIDGDLDELSMPPIQQNSFDLESTDEEFSSDAISDSQKLPDICPSSCPSAIRSMEVEGDTNQIHDITTLPQFRANTQLNFQLAEAAEAGHIEIVQLLLDRGANLNDGGWSAPLANAAKAGHIEMVQLLLDRGANVNEGVWSAPLASAAKAGHIEMVQLLLDRGANVNHGGWNAPLARAAEAGHIEMVQLLLDRGANVNDGGWSAPLAWAAVAGHIEMVQLLLDRGAYVNHGGWSAPLARAAKAGHIEIVQLLLDRGADVNDGGWSAPLTSAAEAGHIEMVQLLLDRGANVNEGGWSAPLARAAKAGHIEIVQLLLDRGAYVNGGQWSGPLASAAKAGHIEMVQLLLDRGANVNEGGWNAPLAKAAEAGHIEVVQLLLDRGANVNEGGWSAPLASAAGAGHIEVVQLLLDRGAYVNGGGWSAPLAWAAVAGHIEIVQLLLDWGADVTVDINLIPTLAEAAAKAGHVSSAHSLQNRFVTAAISGQRTKMHLLLQNGVDINAVTPRGTALSAAARAGHEFSVRWLLRKGADVHTTAIILQGFDDAEFTVPMLFENASRVRNIECARTRRSSRYSPEKVHNLRFLHRKFVTQHMLMIKAAQYSSTNFRELHQRFRSYREAWSAGIRTLRSLCSGESPRNLSDTIAFLCLAKSISETLQRAGACDQSEQFLQDLDRWQLLLESKADRDSYRDAIHCMWGVMLDEISSSQKQADSDLIHFQELASALVSQAGESLGFDALSDTGLGSSQQRWELRNGIIPSSTDSSDIIPGPHRSAGGDTQPQEVVHPRPPDPVVCVTKRTLRQAVEADISSATIEPMAILLMAGTIFAIVVIFLHWLWNMSATGASSSTLFVGINTLQERCQILESYMGVKGYHPVAQANSLGQGKEMVELENYFDFALYYAWDS